LIIIIDCHHCYQSLIHEEQEHNYVHCDSFSEFVDQTTRGGLL